MRLFKENYRSRAYVSIEVEIGRKVDRKMQSNMDEDVVDKARRVRSLLSSFYGEEEVVTPGRFRSSLQGINEPDFDSDRYIVSLVCCILYRVPRW